MSYEDDIQFLTDLYNAALIAGDEETSRKAADHLLHHIHRHIQQQDLLDQKETTPHEDQATPHRACRP